jgi:hypothetical protein
MFDRQHMPEAGLHAKPHPALRQVASANAELITRFAQSQDMTDLVNTSAQKYLELAQKPFGGAAASGAQADLIRSVTENYATFAREHAEPHGNGGRSTGQYDSAGGGCLEDDEPQRFKLRL